MWPHIIVTCPCSPRTLCHVKSIRYHHHHHHQCGHCRVIISLFVCQVLCAGNIWCELNYTPHFSPTPAEQPSPTDERLKYPRQCCAVLWCMYLLKHNSVHKLSNATNITGCLTGCKKIAILIRLSVKSWFRFRFWW